MNIVLPAIVGTILMVGIALALARRLRTPHPKVILTVQAGDVIEVLECLPEEWDIVEINMPTLKGGEHGEWSV